MSLLETFFPSLALLFLSFNDDDVNLRARAVVQDVGRGLCSFCLSRRLPTAGRKRRTRKRTGKHGLLSPPPLPIRERKRRRSVMFVGVYKSNLRAIFMRKKGEQLGPNRLASQRKQEDERDVPLVWRRYLYQIRNSCCCRRRRRTAAVFHRHCPFHSCCAADRRHCLLYQREIRRANHCSCIHAQMAGRKASSWKQTIKVIRSGSLPAGCIHHLKSDRDFHDMLAQHERTSARDQFPVMTPSHG